MATSEYKKKTTFQKVQAILNEAAGGYKADYQGHGNFWETHSVEEIQALEIYGIQMIAPVLEPSCTEMLEDKPKSCCDPEEITIEEEDKVKGLMLMVKPPKPKYPGRGAASGLIKGLKGEFPFDGGTFTGEKSKEGHFPRLPWGGKEVSSSDIKFISDWIDQGCPANQYFLPQTRKPDNSPKYNINLQLTDIYKPKLKQRKNIKNLTDEELYRLRCAMFELKKLNDWPRDRRSLYSWGKLHGNVCEHGWEQFLTWHRMFLYEFEQTLQDIDPQVTLPYWDWTDPEFLQGKIPSEFKDYPNRFLPKKPISGVIPEAYRCWINDKAIENLRANGKGWKKVCDKLEKIKHCKFNSGVEFFYIADITGVDYYTFSPKIIEQLELINPLWYPLRYPGMFYELDDNGNFILGKDNEPIAVGEKGLQQNFHHHYPRAEDVDSIMKVNNWRDFAGGPEYNQSFGVMDMAPHNTIHIWLGGYNKNYKKGDAGEPKVGDMLTNLTAGFDPIFWPHHVMIDRLFHKWQELNPTLGPVNTNGTLAGLGYAVRDALSTERLGYEYVTTGHVFQVESPKGVSVFKSDYISFDTSVYQSKMAKGRVELRFHKVIQPENSFIVRIFLNSPDADMFTPATPENKYYAGSVFFWGHGNCVGGPGHCAPPPEVKRENDIRSPDHNAKRNFIINITETVEKLALEGITEFQINLIVVGPDGSDCYNGFFPEAISLDQT